MRPNWDSLDADDAFTVADAYALLPPAFLSHASMVRPHSSAAGVLALLSESEPFLREHALISLNALVPQFWAEISEQIELMYVLRLYMIYCNSNCPSHIENHYTRAKTSLQMHVTPRRCLQAKSTISSENTTKLYHSL